ncbi:MAG TPA: protein kinase [Nocardioidaceae bacterium]|nr:protein kinase [Nocardioidaceae bacterium]
MDAPRAVTGPDGAGYRGAVAEQRSAVTRVGPYRLVTKIGEGGMGVVHLAEAPDGQRVALKVLRPHMVGDDEARERFVREVTSLRRVTSPRVAEVLDADPWSDTPYVATRYVPGPSLHEHVRRDGRVLGADLAHLATALMEAVVAVHRVGVLHRDIKPSNVLMEGRSPVLIDFGVARLAEDPRLTQTGWLLGTPGYLAPEILYGDDATPASDVHSWAATLAFAASGAPPFGTGPAMAILDRVRRGEHDLSGVPPALLPVVRACLEPDPADRPTTSAVLAALQRSAPSPGSTSTGATAVLPAATAVRVAPRQVPVPAAPPTATRLLTVSTPAPPLQAAPWQPEPSQPAQRPARSGVAALQRAALLGGLFASVALGFARAPYLSLLALCLLVLGLRTVSWTTEVARERRELRGRRRWYDAPLTVLTLPWYLLLAAGGTLVLLAWSAFTASVVGFAQLLFRGPSLGGMVLTGGVVALSLWWGPASRRVRGPLRRLAHRSTRHAGTGWVGPAGLACLAGLFGWSLLTGGVVWEPSAGPPWAPGTPLGALLRWL